MKTKMTTPPAPAACAVHQADSPKLVSLLALAAGAVAMPHTGSADIIYTDMSSSPVVVGHGGTTNFDFALPGTARFGFLRDSHTGSVGTVTFPVTFCTVTAGDRGGIAVAQIRGAGGLAANAAFGASWSQGTATWNYVTVGKAHNYGHTPVSGYDHQYLAWVFEDSSQGGSPLRYGWVEVSLSNVNIATGNAASGPNVTIWGYAYDNTGLKPTMGQGQVPEPTSISLLVLGALALGARGLRSWRRNKDAESSSQKSGQ